ncbi:hypothetical protein Cgig2_004704 [Carnegiea gigantea]|uniref:Uncharacterized protein n=1 Tax=Carnegiea gigantea TaxID=171969 RepID=A0A9Q1GPT5_9CARY|nr:hypothetical protein Cgig2_004704 [Carnegiea gigantea]
MGSHVMRQGPKYHFLGDVLYSRKLSLIHFMSGVNASDKGVVGSKPKVEIIYFGKPLKPFAPPIEDNSSCELMSPATPIAAIPIQSIALLAKVTNEIKKHFQSSPTEICRQKLQYMIDHIIGGQGQLNIKVCKPSIKKVIELPPEGVGNIMDILDVGLNPAECMGSGLDGLKGGTSFFNVDAVTKEVGKNAAWMFSQATLDKVSRTPFDGLPFKGNFDSLYAIILQRGIGVNPLENEDSCCIEAQGKLDNAPGWLNTADIHYEEMALT